MWIYSKVIYSCEFSASLLQSSVSHDPSEITLIWGSDDQEIFPTIMNVEHFIFLWKNPPLPSLILNCLISGIWEHTVPRQIPTSCIVEKAKSTFELWNCEKFYFSGWFVEQKVQRHFFSKCTVFTVTFDQFNASLLNKSVLFSINFIIFCTNIKKIEWFIITQEKHCFFFNMVRIFTFFPNAPEKGFLNSEEKLKMN